MILEADPFSLVIDHPAQDPTLINVHTLYYYKTFKHCHVISFQLVLSYDFYTFNKYTCV